MFDPTAFENIKVVIEGALYDRDLDGEIIIIDRNDFVNLAKLSRTYEVTFALAGKYSATGTFQLRAELENLAAELLPPAISVAKAGVQVEISFHFAHENKQEIHEWIKAEMKRIWGKDRIYQQSVCYDPLAKSSTVEKEIKLAFNRLIYEDQIDDMEEMIAHMVLTLEKLEDYLKR